jgi:uncharacterized protein YbbC (DUF1343 family)
MKQRIPFILLLQFLLSQTEHPSIHQEQLEKYKTKPDPTIEKVHVLTGLDVLLEKKQDLIQGKSIALVTNHSGIDRFGVPNYKRLMAMDNVDLKVIFSPNTAFLGRPMPGRKSPIRKII